MALSYADVGEILKMIDTSSCAEVILELDGIKMVVRKGGKAHLRQKARQSPVKICRVSIPHKRKAYYPDLASAEH